MFDESLAEYYYHKLEKESNHAVLVEFLRITQGWESVDKQAYKIVGRLSNIYGLEIVYYSVLDILFAKEVNMNNLAGLLSYFCKKRLEAKNQPLTNINLSKDIKQREKLLDRKRFPKVKDDDGK